MNMKIIGGVYKGRNIEMPVDIRPTSDKVRGALFEILKNRIEGSIFMDLYCGSGAVGLEALSRGAERGIFVDNSKRSINILKKNIETLRIQKNRVDIYLKDVLEFIRIFTPPRYIPDIIFLDPPYYTDLPRKTLLQLSKCDILTPHTLIIIQLFKKDILAEEVEIFKRVNLYRYGDTILEFYAPPRPKS